MNEVITMIQRIEIANTQKDTLNITKNLRKSRAKEKKNDSKIKNRNKHKICVCLGFRKSNSGW